MLEASSVPDIYMPGADIFSEIIESITLKLLTSPPPQTGDTEIIIILAVMIACGIAFIIVSRFKKR